MRSFQITSRVEVKSSGTPFEQYPLHQTADKDGPSAATLTWEAQKIIGNPCQGPCCKSLRIVAAPEYIRSRPNHGTEESLKANSMLFLSGHLTPGRDPEETWIHNCANYVPLFFASSLSTANFLEAGNTLFQKLSITASNDQVAPQHPKLLLGVRTPWTKWAARSICKKLPQATRPRLRDNRD